MISNYDLTAGGFDKCWMLFKKSVTFTCRRRNGSQFTEHQAPKVKNSSSWKNLRVNKVIPCTFSLIKLFFLPPADVWCLTVFLTLPFFFEERSEGVIVNFNIAYDAC